MREEKSAFVRKTRREERREDSTFGRVIKI